MVGSGGPRRPSPAPGPGWNPDFDALCLFFSLSTNRVKNNDKNREISSLNTRLSRFLGPQRHNNTTYREISCVFTEYLGIRVC